MTTKASQSPPHPQPGPDPRPPDHPETTGPARDHAQSPDRANMDPLPPANERDMRASVEAARRRRQDADHRGDVAGQAPVPSEHYFPPVEDDRAHRLKPGPPKPDDEEA